VILLGWIGTLLALMAAIGVALEEHDQHVAEARRAAERLDLTAGLARFDSMSVNERTFIAPVSAAPWSLTGDARDQALLGAFTHSAPIGANATVALARPDGTILVNTPAGSPPGITPDDPAWRTARDGHTGNSTVRQVAGVARSYYAIPVLRDGRAAAIVLVGLSVRDSVGQQALSLVGTLGFASYGISVTDASGRVLASWDPKLLGKPIVNASRLATVPAHAPVRLPDGPDPTDPDGHGPTMVTVAARLQGFNNGQYIVLRQPESIFYRGVRGEPAAHNGLLLAMVAVALIGLGLSDRARAESIRRERGQLDALLHNAHDIVAVVDRSGRTIFVSSAVERLLGHPVPTAAVLGLTGLADVSEAARLRAFLGEAVGRDRHVLTDVRMRAADGTTRWFDVTTTDLAGRYNINHILLTLRDISERKDLQDQLRHAAHHDALTGLPNRAALDADLPALAGDPDTPYAILFIDLDRFKPVNDTYGHDAGDEVLRAVASRLRTEFRGGDAVYRYGGDEFVAILPDLDHARARAVAARVLAAIREPVDVGPAIVDPDASIGVAVARAGAEPDRILREADQEMYRVKHSRRGSTDPARARPDPVTPDPVTPDPVTPDPVTPDRAPARAAGSPSGG
jgi:diguanylate cyclase (GGDEF)-like protein/PAS domain S-box-containing protein